jgi:hypothetical protein
VPNGAAIDIFVSSCVASAVTLISTSQTWSPGAIDEFSSVNVRHAVIKKLITIRVIIKIPTERRISMPDGLFSMGSILPDQSEGHGIV